MKIRVKVANSCLTLSKKSPPHLFQILATRLSQQWYMVVEKYGVWDVGRLGRGAFWAWGVWVVGRLQSHPIGASSKCGVT